MDEYQHMERFSMEKDFSGGQWVEGEFFFRKREERHNQTKEEALYGSFLEDSDSDDDSRRKKRRGDLVKKGDLTKPVNFVSTGIVKPTEEVNKIVEEEEEGDAQRPGLGLGSGGLGSKASKIEKQEDVVEDLFPTAFGRQIVEAAERRQREKEEKLKQAAAKAKGDSERPPRMGGGGGSVQAAFEKHTRGIGKKLLEKMGYKGGGLGRNEQGIAIPIEARFRPQKMGMGFNDFKETNNAVDPALRRVEEAKVTVVEVKQKPQEKLWHTKNRVKKKKDYRTAEELLNEKQGFELVQTVLDMRGPQVKLITNMENLNATQETYGPTKTPIPELQHNIRLIVDLAEAEIQACDRKLLHERDSAVIKHSESERLQKDLLSQKQQINVMEAIMTSLQKLQETIAGGGMDLEVIARSFANLQSKHREEYELYSLAVIGLSFVMPHMVTMFRGWDPLQHPFHGTKIMGTWQQLLQGNQDFAVFPGVESGYGSTSPYTQLVVEALMPSIRLSATNVWEPRDAEPMLRFLEAWEKLLPAGVMQNILEGLVMPKLTAAVDAWDPQVETVPIHAWLHPWLPLLGPRMEPLYPPIRYKLMAALQAWHPSDSSAYSLLSPWQAVFDPNSWEQLLVRSIVPKLMYALQEFVINPAHQQLDQFNWVMAWATAVPIHHVAGMLEAGFFPRWQQTLYQWLCNNPNYEEVTRWYLGWKSLFPAELLANERIRRQMNVALDMMNQAVEGGVLVQPGAQENLSYLRVTEQRQFESQQQAAYQQQQQQQQQQHHHHGVSMGQGLDNSGAEDMTLKEVVETFAANNDVQFVPKLGRVNEGLQVYGFGMVSVCLDSAKQVVLAQNANRWFPVSLDQLLEMNRTRSKTRGKWQHV